MLIRHPNYAICLFLALALLLQACAPTAVEQPEPEPVTLKVITFPFLGYAPFFIAEEEGYFAEQGLEIEFVNLRGPGAIVALIEGEADVWAGFLQISYLNAMAQGANLKYVAGKGYIAPTGCPYMALMARRTLVEAGQLAGVAQLQGRRIDLVPASFQGFFVETLLNTAGLALDDLEVMKSLRTSMPSEARGKGTMDVTTTSEPWVTRIIQEGNGVLWMSAEQVLPDFQFGFVVYGTALLEENPDAGRRFMVAYLKAVQQYSQGKTERNLEILAEHTGLDRELLTQACWLPIRESGQINAQSILDFQAWTVEKGYLDNPGTEEQFWDPSFIEYANEVLGAPSQ